MAQAGVYAPGPVIDADVIIRVNGVVREHVSMDWAGDTTGGLPDQVVSAGTGMRSRTGTIHWSQEDVQVEPPHPLRQTGGWPPREGDSVVIDATVDTGSGPYTFRRFTGRLGRTTGSLTDGTLTSEITDTLGDQLRAPCTIPPMITGLYTKSMWVTYTALEQAGLGVLPPPDEHTIGHVTVQGGADAQVGSITPGKTGIGYGTTYGVFSNSGLQLAPTTVDRAGRDYLVMGRAQPGYDSVLSISLTSGVEITLTHRVASHTLALFVSGVGFVWEGPSTDGSPLPVLAVQITSTGLRAYTSPTTYVTTSSYRVPSAVGVRWVSGTRLIGRTIRRFSGSAIGPGIVARTPALPTAWEGSALESEFLGATRGVENVRARDVVDAWGEATLTAVWMDETGKPWAVARDRLLSRPVSRTLRVEERVMAGSWSVGDDQVHSSVVVKGLRATVTRAPGLRTVLYQPGNVQAIDAEEPMEQIIRVPDHEDWIGLDTDWRPVRKAREGIVNDADFADREGSFWQIVFADPSDGDRYRWTGSAHQVVSASIERLGQRAVKITHLVTGDRGAGLDYYLASPSVGITYPLPYQGVPMPILRGRALVAWTDYTVTGATTGPSWAPRLEHDADWWLTPTNAQRFADALAAEITQAMPTLSGVTVLWDPTRQIGDVEEWTAVDKTGAESWRARVLVTGYSEAWDGQVPSQQVDVRVISWTDPIDGKTYGDLAAAYSSYAGITGTYQQVYDALPGAR